MCSEKHWEGKNVGDVEQLLEPEGPTSDQFRSCQAGDCFELGAVGVK